MPRMGTPTASIVQIIGSSRQITKILAALRYLRFLTEPERRPSVGT